MSQEYCWQFGESYSRDEVLDIPVFNKGFTLKWCLNCVMRQLQWTDYRLIPKPAKYKKFKINSCEDRSKEYQNVVEELKLCFEHQFRKLKEIDSVWGELQQLAIEMYYHLGVLVIFGIVFFIVRMAGSTNPYPTFKNDCENIYQKNFTVNQTCYPLFRTEETPGYDCQKVNWTGLEEFCYNDWKNSGGKT